MSEKKRMENITICLPEIMIENLEKLREIGIVNSRSEAIRTAIREFLEKETETMKLLNYIPEVSK